MITFISVGVVFEELSRLAFVSRRRKRVKKESRGFSKDCGKYVGEENIIAGHLVHGTGELLERDENAVARCFCCEARYHLEHSDHPSEIGLNKQENDPVVYGHVNQLNEVECAQLIAEFPLLWDGVLKRLKRYE